jgi:hypothetical protein
MNRCDFSLEPFPPGSSRSGLKITGYLTRPAHRLAIRYVLSGLLEKLLIPAPADPPVRRRRLWEETCFEFFLGVKGAPHYWEFNLSPAGHWNVYRFSGYRQGMAEAAAFGLLPFSVHRQPDSLSVTLDVDIGRIVAADQSLAIGLAAVLQFKDQGLSYWALAHPGPRPDFHRREGFGVEL